MAPHRGRCQAAGPMHSSAPIMQVVAPVAGAAAAASATNGPAARRLPPPADLRCGSWPFVLAGTVLIGLATLPVYRLLDAPETGLAGAFTVAYLDLQFEFVWTGLLLLLPLFLFGARFVPAAAEALICRAAASLARVATLKYATLLAVTAAALAAGFALFVLDAAPNQIDSLAQMLHARFWAEGRLAGPPDDGGGFWLIQNSIFTERGWVSQYPPGHVLVLAAFTLVGVPWAAGPVLVGVTVFFATLVADRLLPERPGLARVAAAALAVSPFFLFIGGSFMNHVSAAAGVTVGAWALLRAWHHHEAWAVAAGAAFGLAFVTRPLSTLAMAAALTLAIPFAASAPFRFGRFLRSIALIAAGAAPFGLALLAYNFYFFGAPFTFGYELALGPRMGLGFGLDPWGNLYGVREAVAYTSADLMTLGINLLETPLSALLVVGAFLVARRLTAGERVLVFWALAPVAANTFYWHHGQFMGPRMLHEAAPAWVLLTVVGGAGLVDRVPGALQLLRFRPRAGLGVVMAGALAFGLLFLTPQRGLSYGGAWLEVTRVPPAPAVGPALVFVHDAWTGRIAMTLATHGYRFDVVETLLRQNSTCRVHHLAEAVVARDTAAERSLLAALNSDPRASGLPVQVSIAPGNKIRVEADEPLTPACMQQARSDARGILDIAPLLWRGELPSGAEAGTGTLYVRDLGPVRNRALLEQHPHRQHLVYMLPHVHAQEPVVLPYDDGMQLLWGAL
jgi:hypothetical protein